MNDAVSVRLLCRYKVNDFWVLATAAWLFRGGFEPSPRGYGETAGTRLWLVVIERQEVPDACGRYTYWVSFQGCQSTMRLFGQLNLKYVIFDSPVAAEGTTAQDRSVSVSLDAFPSLL